MQSRLMRRPLLSLVLLVTSSAFHSGGRVRLLHSRSRPPPLRALGDFTVELEKPLGVILEEEEASGRGGGVRVESLVAEGAAAASGAISPGDTLLKVGDEDVSSFGFDDVMDLLAAAPTPLRLTLGDGLGRMDMAKNIAKTLSPEQVLCNASLTHSLTHSCDFLSRPSSL